MTTGKDNTIPVKIVALLYSGRRLTHDQIGKLVGRSGRTVQRFTQRIEPVLHETQRQLMEMRSAEGRSAR